MAGNPFGAKGNRFLFLVRLGMSDKDTVAVATAMETAAAGAATTAAGTPTTAPGIGADRIAYALAWEGCGCWL